MCCFDDSASFKQEYEAFQLWRLKLHASLDAWFENLISDDLDLPDIVEVQEQNSVRDCKDY